MSTDIINLIKTRLSIYNPKKLGINLPDASVLIPIIDKPEPSILLTLRSVHLRDHAGQVAFPGGKTEPGDINLYATALREAREEIGLDSEKVEYLGELSQVMSIANFRVSSFVVKIPDNLHLVPQTGELSAIFEIPLSFFDVDNRSWTDVLGIDKHKFYVPSYDYNGYRLWGLSAMLVVEFLKIGLNKDIDLNTYPADKPVKFRSLPNRFNLS